MRRPKVEAITRRVMIVIALATALAILPAESSFASATTNDLETDWSDTSNPNGVWTYREGTDALPSVPNWTPLPVAPSVQPAWAPSVSSGNFLPAWFKSTTDNPIGMDFLVGDVVVHSTDALNGQFSGVSNVIWTSPINGVIDISGAVWMARDIGRSNIWELLLNGVSLTSGVIFSGDPFDRDNPFDFAAGSGGPLVLDDIAVSNGDVIELRIVKTSGSGDIVGVKLTITPPLIVDMPIPGLTQWGLILMAALLATVLLWERRRVMSREGHSPWR